MRNTHLYYKYNFLSCLYIVKDFEKKDSIMDKKVRDTCMSLYNLEKIQKSDEIKEEDVYYKRCMGGSAKLPGKVDCKNIVISCSKLESLVYPLLQCVDDKINEIKDGKT